MTNKIIIDEKLLTEVADLALEKCAGDKEAAMAFVDAFIKEAAGEFRTHFDPKDRSVPEARGYGSDLTSSLIKGLGSGIGGLAVTAGISAIGGALNGAKSSALHSKFLAALEKAISMNQVLKGAKKEKVLAYGETIFKFAPNVATDPNVLASILANAIHGDGVDLQTVKAMGELESRYTMNNTFNPKNYS